MAPVARRSLPIGINRAVGAGRKRSPARTLALLPLGMHPSGTTLGAAFVRMKDAAPFTRGFIRTPCLGSLPARACGANDPNGKGSGPARGGSRRGSAELP